MGDSEQATSIADLGVPIGAGRTAEVFPFGEGRVLRLLLADIPADAAQREADAAVVVARVYQGAPRSFGTTLIGGRVGIVYERIDGPTMDQQVRRTLWRVASLARTLGELHAAMHESSGVGLPDQRVGLRLAIDRAAIHLPARAHDAALTRLEALPRGAVVCHGDLHPGNVIIGPDRAVAIDWDNASSGAPAADVARAIYLMRDTPISEPPILRPFVRAIRNRFTSEYLARYRDIRRLDAAELDAWRLPILAARMAEGIDSERAALHARIEQELQGDAAVPGRAT